MSTTLQEIKPSAIKPHKHNPRHDVGDVDELAASIAEQGLLEPLIVAPNGTGDTYTLIAGHRRLAAAKSKRLKTVLCLVREDLTDPAAQLEVMLVENLQRSDLTPLEEAEAYQQLLEFPGYTQTKIATATGRAIATVRARLKMAKLPKSALTKIHEGQISLAAATALVEFAGTKQFKELEAAAGTDRFPYLLSRAKDERSKERRRERVEKELAAAEVRVIDPPDFRTLYTRLHGTAVVEEHRSCDGFAAFIESWSGNAVYVCDKPELHEEQARAEEQAETEARRERIAQLAEATKTRRAHLGQFLEGPIAGIAVDVLRQQVLEKGRGAAWLGDVLGIEWSDGKARTKRVGELDVDQLALVLDLIKHTYDEAELERESGFGLGSYGNGPTKWHERLTSVYGYQWSPLEAELLELAEQKRTERAAAKEADEDDDDSEDEAPDFDDDPAWDDES